MTGNRKSVYTTRSTGAPDRLSPPPPPLSENIVFQSYSRACEHVGHLELTCCKSALFTFTKTHLSNLQSSARPSCSTPPAAAALLTH